jgi:uncharacterized protein YecT (DUF1311 family)
MRHLLRIAVLVAATVLLGHGARASEHDRWSKEAPVTLAGETISECLAEGASDIDSRLVCVRRPYLVCEREHGTQTTIDMGECLGFARSAWEERLELQLGRISERVPTDVWERIAASQRAWEDWSASDCEALASSYEGGTIHSLTIGWCLLRHAGARALHIEALADDIDR